SLVVRIRGPWQGLNIFPGDQVFSQWKHQHFLITDVTCTAIVTGGTKCKLDISVDLSMDSGIVQVDLGQKNLGKEYTFLPEGSFYFIIPEHGQKLPKAKKSFQQDFNNLLSLKGPADSMEFIKKRVVQIGQNDELSLGSGFLTTDIT
ncbi:MAG: hypothetical protein ACK55I_35120, partial [bacterium]